MKVWPRTAAAGLVTSALMLVSALDFALVASKAGSLGNLGHGIHGVDSTSGLECSDGHLVEENAVEPGTEVESHGIVFELVPTSREVGTNAVTVTLAFLSGEPVTGAIVFATIRMPAMDHGLSAYPARETEDGRYSMDHVSLGMAGEWLVTIEAIRQARAPAMATFRIQLGDS